MSKPRPQHQAKNRRKPPPVETRFKKGQSGNPGGRPKGDGLTSMLRKYMAEKDPSGKSTWGERICMALVRKAAKGNVQAFEKLADRVEGKVRDRVEITGAEGGSIVFEIVERKA